MISVIRARLGADPEWQAEYFQRILPWLQHQDNTTLSSLAGSPPGPGTTHQGAGTYEVNIGLYINKVRLQIQLM